MRGWDLLTETEVAEVLGVHSQTLYRWRRDGHGPSWLRIGRQVRYRRDHLERWLNDHQGAAQYQRPARARRRPTRQEEPAPILDAWVAEYNRRARSAG